MIIIQFQWQGGGFLLGIYILEPMQLSTLVHRRVKVPLILLSYSEQNMHGFFHALPSPAATSLLIW
jgi:hypothetical protein